MSLSRWLALGLVSTAGIMPASLGGQSVQAPRHFEAVASGDQILARWSAVPDAELYVGEIDTDPRFGDPREWLERNDGRGVYEQRLTNLAPRTYYLRVRAVRSAFLVRRQSDWSHVERVNVGGRSDRGGLPGRRPGDDRWPDDRRDDDWPDGRRDDRWPDDRRFPDGDASPRNLDARTSGDDLLVRWSSLRGADRYVLQLDRDSRFRDPRSIGVPADGGGTQEVRLRDLPDGRWYLRIRGLDGVGLGGTRWSSVETVIVNGRNVVRRTNAVRRDVVFLGRDRGHPVFDDHPGRGRGHENHSGKPNNPGHARDGDWRDRDDRWDHDDDWRGRNDGDRDDDRDDGDDDRDDD